MTDDVVAELDDWLAREATTPKHYPADDVDTGLLQRARGEIVRLRAQLEAVAPLRIAIADALAAARREARDEALEEAARVCDRLGLGVLDDGAAAIRALKGGPKCP